MNVQKRQIAIAEDEAQFAQQLKADLLRYGKENHVDLDVSIYDNGAAFLERYQANWDIVFLDIDMPVMDGLTAAKSLRAMDKQVMIIFMTSLAQYATHGYEVGAFDYILKPCGYYELAMKLRLALRHLDAQQDKTVLIKQDGDMYRLPLSQVYYIEIFSHQIHYHTQQGIYKLSTGKTLADIEKELSGDGFVRCSKSVLLNARHIDSIQGDTIHIAGQELLVSRSHRKEVLQTLLRLAKGGNLI